MNFLLKAEYPLSLIILNKFFKSNSILNLFSDCIKNSNSNSSVAFFFPIFITQFSLSFKNEITLLSENKNLPPKYFS